MNADDAWATQCPGPAVWAAMRGGLFVAQPDPVVVPPSEQVADMIRLDYMPGSPQWCALLFGDRQLTHISNGHTADMLTAGGVKTVSVSTDQLVGILSDSSLRAIGACPFVEPVPAELRVAWDRSARGY